jgi:hypothetical protein
MASMAVSTEKGENGTFAVFMANRHIFHSLINDIQRNPIRKIPGENIDDLRAAGSSAVAWGGQGSEKIQLCK